MIFIGLSVCYLENVSDGEFVEAVSKGNPNRMGVACSFSTLLLSVFSGNAAKVGELLREKGALVQMEFNKDGVTALMLASNKGHKEVKGHQVTMLSQSACVWQVCEILLQSKAEVNLKDRKYGWTALLHATHYK